MAPAAWVVLGTLVWAGASTLSRFDVLLTFSVLTALTGLELASRDRAGGDGGSGRRMIIGWLLFGLGTGLGVLSKGPVVLVFTLPAALLAPLWIRGTPLAFWRQWYLGVGAGIALAATVALAWALPAAASGGPAYGDAILWGQTGSRIVDAAAHGRPFWWYPPMLLVFFFPWIWWPPFWRSLPRPAWRTDRGLRFCAAWLVGGLVLLSIISGKQPHYLLPLVPALALLLARAIAVSSPGGRRTDAVPAIVLALAGLAVTVIAASAIIFPDWASDLRLPPGAAGALLGLGVVMVGLGVVLIFRRREPAGSVSALALTSIGTVIAFHLAAAGPVTPLYDLEPAAQRIAALSRAGQPIAHVGKYHGQYQFLGRLVTPIAVITGDQVADWIDLNPDGAIIAYHRTLPEPVVAPIYSQPFRSRVLAIWDADGARADLGRFRR